MKITVLLGILVFWMSACTPAATVAPALPVSTPGTPTAAPQATAALSASSTSLATELSPSATQQPTAPSSSPAVQPPEGWSVYANPTFGFGFAYPPGWFGPEEYVSENTLRVEVGSDTVYPYGTSPEERVATLTNAYFIVLQYTRNNQNDYWKETYAALSAMADGEESSGARERIIRVRAVQVGRFSGIEYITTLSETAQTEPIYSRSVILGDDQSNLLTIMGTPGNVELAGSNWRTVYQSIDAENEDLFHQMIETLVIE